MVKTKPQRGKTIAIYRVGIYYLLVVWALAEKCLNYDRPPLSSRAGPGQLCRDLSAKKKNGRVLFPGAVRVGLIFAQFS
jgi:hypothetical protein